MQTNHVSPAALVMACAMALFSGVEIKASRPYKALKRRTGSRTEGELSLMMRYEAILKEISLGVILAGRSVAYLPHRRLRILKSSRGAPSN